MTTNATQPAPVPDVTCIHCGRAHFSFGILPLCPRCTRQHAAALPKPKHAALPKQITRAMDRALVAISHGEKVRAEMIERLGAQGLVTPKREKRMSGAGGMPSVWFVVVGATLTPRGTRRLAQHTAAEEIIAARAALDAATAKGGAQ